MTEIPIVVGALGTVPKSLDNRYKELKIRRIKIRLFKPSLVVECSPMDQETGVQSPVESY